MIRLLLALLVIAHFGLVSCTMGEIDEPDSETSEPISDGDAGVDSADATDSDSASEDADLDEDFEDDGTVAENEPAGSEDDLEDDLDAEPADDQQAKAEPAPVDELEPANEPPPPEAEPTPEPSEPIPAPTPVVEKARVRDIKFLANSSGGTVLIETSKPVSYQTRLNAATQQFVVELADVELPPSLQRPYNTKGEGSRIGGINAYQSAGSSTARVVIQLTGAPGGEPIVQPEGSSLVIIPPTPAPVAQAEPPAPPPAAPEGEETPAPAAPAAKGQSLSARTLDEFLTGNQRFFGRNISLQVKDADVRDVVNFLAEESGANIVMSDDVEGKISLKLRKVPWDQALVTVMRTKGLGYVRQGNVLRISTLKSLQAETEATAKILEAQKNIVPAVVEVIPISYSNIDDLTKTLGAFVSKDGKVVADNRTSTIIVTDKGEVVERVRKLIKTLDIPPAQVSIESKIVEAVENFQNFVGVSWGFTGAELNLSPGGGYQGAPIDLTMGVTSATLSRSFQGANPFNTRLQVGTLDFFGDLTATLTLAERDSLAKVISSPRISAMNREKSTITQEGETVSVVSSRNEQTNVVTKQDKKTPYKLELEVTPQITADSAVIMDLNVKREFPGPIEDEETKSRGVNKRSAKTKVLVKNGQTAVIGGIYTSDELEAQSGVPGLKNLPIIGWLFKNKSYERTKNELLIFLTPRILAQDDLSQNSASLQ